MINDPILTTMRFHSLTNQEKRVLNLLSEGKLYKEVAAILFISENTVRSHVRKLYCKLGVHSKAEMVKSAMQSMIISEQ